jgi:hypothetical protein
MLFIVGAVVPVTFLLARVFGLAIWIMFVLGECILLFAGQFARPYKSIPNPTPTGVRRGLIVVAISAAISFIAGWLPLNTTVQFWFYHSQIEALATRIPPSPVSYYGFGTTRIGPYVPQIDRYPHWLGIGIGLDAFCPENWRDLCDQHGVYFILEDDPGYEYNNTRRIHLSANWYSGEP